MADSEKRKPSRRRSYSDEDFALRAKKREAQEAEARLLKKKRRAKKKKAQKTIGAFFWILLILCLLVVISKTPVFNIQKISITGFSMAKEEDILKASGIKKGDNIFIKMPGKIEEQVRTVPYISGARVKLRLPSTVDIAVSEAPPVAYVRFSKRAVAVDKNGKTIKELTEKETEGLTAFTGLSDAEFKMGSMIKTKDSDKTEILIACLDCIDKYQIKNVSVANISELNYVTLTVGAMKIKLGELGTKDYLAYKMAYIKEVMDNLPDNVGGVVDATDIEAGVTYRSEETPPEPVKPKDEEKPKDETAKDDTASQTAQENKEEDKNTEETEKKTQNSE